MSLPDFDNFQKWINYFKEKPIYKIWLASPLILLFIIVVQHNQNNELKSQIAPIRDLYPKLELSAAVARVMDDYKSLKAEVNEIQSPKIEVKQIDSNKFVEGRYITSLELNSKYVVPNFCLAAYANTIVDFSISPMIGGGFMENSAQGKGFMSSTIPTFIGKYEAIVKTTVPEKVIFNNCTQE